MKKKLFLLLVCILVVMPLTQSLEFNATNRTRVYNIDECGGPVFVQTTPTNNDLRLIGCVMNNESVWECECDDEFELIVDVDRVTDEYYDFKIQYFIENVNFKPSDNRTPSRSEILASDYKRLKTIKNVSFVEPEQSETTIEFDVQPENVIVAVVIVFIGILFIVYKLFFKRLKSNNKENDDIFNYKM